jgi:hypothetical protein
MAGARAGFRGGPRNGCGLVWETGDGRRETGDGRRETGSDHSAPRSGVVGWLRLVAQLAEHRSPKPGVAGSSPAGPVRQMAARCARPLSYWRRQSLLLPALRPLTRTETPLVESSPAGPVYSLVMAIDGPGPYYIEAYVEPPSPAVPWVRRFGTDNQPSSSPARTPMTVFGIPYHSIGRNAQRLKPPRKLSRRSRNNLHDSN